MCWTKLAGLVSFEVQSLYRIISYRKVLSCFICKHECFLRIGTFFQ